MNKHFYLQNHKKEYPSYNRKRNFTKKEDNDEEKLPKIINQAKIGVLRSNYRTYNNDKERRDSNRTLDLPIIIDLIRVSFHKVFNYELQKLFFSKYGLIPIDYTDFNQTVLFEIEDVEAYN